jgi:hypothetical protein
VLFGLLCDESVFFLRVSDLTMRGAACAFLTLGLSQGSRNGWSVSGASATTGPVDTFVFAHGVPSKFGDTIEGLMALVGDCLGIDW